MSLIYCNPNDFVPNLLKLIEKERYKTIEVSQFDILDIQININKYRINYNKDTQILKIKTGNKIRNPKNFNFFIDTFIETKLILNDNLNHGQIKIKEIHPYSSYIQESIKKLVEQPLESQQNIIITTQFPSLKPIIIRGFDIQYYNRVYKAQ